jgi:hypothetical protein
VYLFEVFKQETCTKTLYNVILSTIHGAPNRQSEQDAPFEHNDWGCWYSQHNGSYSCRTAGRLCFLLLGAQP